MYACAKKNGFGIGRYFGLGRCATKQECVVYTSNYKRLNNPKPEP